MNIQDRMRRRKTSEENGFSNGGRDSTKPESADAGWGCPSLELVGMVKPHMHIGNQGEEIDRSKKVF